MPGVRNTAHWKTVGCNYLIELLVSSLAELESLYARTLYSAKLAVPVQLRSALSAPYSSDQLQSAVFHHTPASGVLASSQNPLLSDNIHSSYPGMAELNFVLQEQVTAWRRLHFCQHQPYCIRHAEACPERGISVSEAVSSWIK